MWAWFHVIWLLVSRRPCLPPLLNILRERGADYEHDRISKLRAEWQPQGAAETLMTCINGAWPFFPDCCQARTLFCPAAALSLSAGVGASQGAFDLHTHSGSVPAFARPLKDDKIQCWVGAGSREPAGCSLEDFNFAFLSLPFLFPLSHNVCAFLRAPMWLQQGKGAHLRGHMSQIGLQILQHQLKALHLQEFGFYRCSSS